MSYAVDFTTDTSILRSELRASPDDFQYVMNALLQYVRHARAAVTHNMLLRRGVRRWPTAADKRRAMHELTDNIDKWRANTASACAALRARRAALVSKGWRTGDGILFTSYDDACRHCDHVYSTTGAIIALEAT